MVRVSVDATLLCAYRRMVYANMDMCLFCRRECSLCFQTCGRRSVLLLHCEYSCRPERVSENIHELMVLIAATTLNTGQVLLHGKFILFTPTRSRTSESGGVLGGDRLRGNDTRVDTVQQVMIRLRPHGCRLCEIIATPAVLVAGSFKDCKCGGGRITRCK